MDVNKVFDYMNKNLLTTHFLSLVEKWARYDGKDFYIGDMDVSVINKGTFTVSTETPKITVQNKKIHISELEKETNIDTYDVTEIRNSAVCSDYDTRILIAERYKDFMNENWIKTKPARLYIYSIFSDEDADNSQYTYRPSFERLKKDFESKTFTHYNSMLYEFCGDYKLVPFNNDTDRIFNYSGIQGDLEWLELEDESKELSAHIKIVNRLTKEERDSIHEENMIKMEERIKNKKNEN